MKTIIQLEEVNLTFIQDLWTKFLNVLPKMLLAIGFLILAWIFLKITLFILKRLLSITKIDSITTKLNEAELFGKSNYNVVPSTIILKFIKYLMILIFVIIAAELLGLEIVSVGIAKFISYLPILISALLIFVFGVYIASLIKKAIKNTLKSLEINGSNLISNIAFYLIVIIVSITALNQAGIDTAIITNILILVLGSILVSFTIAFGLGSRDVILRLLFGFYSRRNFKIGQHIKTNKIEGTIQQIDNICITIKTSEGVVVLPIKDFVDKKIQIK